MIYLRRIIQLTSLLLFVYLIITTTEPLSSAIPNNLFFVTNPLIALTIIMASRTFVLTFLTAFAIILATIFLGRVYCGWVCPLGTTLDIFKRLGIRQIKGLKVPSGWRRIKYGILMVILISAIFGVGIAGWVDPISLTYKAYALFVYPNLAYVAKEVLHGLGFSQLVSDLIGLGVIPHRDISFHYSLLFIIIFAVIILLNFIQTRFWCRNLCPLGALLGLLSRWRFLRVQIGLGCRECVQCIKVCNMGAVYRMEQPTEGNDRIVLDEECIHCFTCKKRCAFNIISVGFEKKPEAKTKISVLPSRRGLLTAAVLGAVSVPLMRYNFSRKKAESLVCLRPPGAERDENVFLAKCIRCGECMKACPTNGLQPALFQNGFYGMWSPVLIPRIGYCDYECNLCIRVCPSAALTPLDLNEKKQWKIGSAQVDLTRCTNCLTCEEHCPVPEKAIKIRVQGGLSYPQVVEDLCTGCGVCENACPESPAAIRVVPVNLNLS